ncbi:hypothetical protein PAMA_005648 [Pampus argenteus]
MLYANQSQTNITVGLQYQGLLERLMFSTVTSVPCCVFLFINGTMLFTLRSKHVFRETSRYILLYNLLFADTVQMALSQLLYILAASRLWMTYPLCGALVMLGHLTRKISPLTLVVMSLERYVAVCYPLRHATIITKRNTGVAICVIWTISSLNVLTQVLLMINSHVEDTVSLQMKDFCGKESIFLDQISDLYDKAYTYCLFVSAGIVVSCSYIGVMVAARSASTDRDSAVKARKTLLLHLVQLGLSLSSTLHNLLLIAISKIIDRILSVRIQIFLYVLVIILPRCLSALIYGIRDQTIRPVLVYHLCCQWKRSPLLSVVPAKAKISILIAS